MSTIPSTPEQQLPYTVVGRRDRETDPLVPGVVLLNRSSRLVRHDYIADLVAGGFSEIVSVESRENAFSVESLSRDFPTIRFLLLDRPASVGAGINLAMSLMNANNVLVMWSTMDPPENLLRAADLLGNEGGNVCLAPALRNERGESLPVVQVPAMQRRQLKVMALPLRGRAADTLFPFDYTGLYDRKRFLRYGRYDEAISRTFWQKMDFGFRIAMWGDRIRVDPTFRMRYRSMPEPEDQTASLGYSRFFARNLAVRIRDGGAVVPRLQAFPFALRSGRSIPEAIKVFREAAHWVEDNRELFLKDARTVVKEWSVDNG